MSCGNPFPSLPNHNWINIEGNIIVYTVPKARTVGPVTLYELTFVLLWLVSFAHVPNTFHPLFAASFFI